MPTCASFSFWASLVMLWASPLFGADLNVPADYTTIQAAIDAAEDGDRILIAPGAYDEFLNAGTKALTLVGTGGSAQTVIDANGDSGTLLLVDGASSFGIEGITFRNGRGSRMTELRNIGQVVVQGCRWLGADVSSNGAALCLSSVSEFNLSGCSWISNRASGQSDGCVYVVDSDGQLLDPKFELNQAFDGGAIYFTGGSTVDIAGGSFVSNQASDDGGAILVLNSSITLSDTVFDSNSAVTGSASIVASGGALYADGSSQITGVDLVFLRNHVFGPKDAQGGAVYLRNGAELELQHCIFNENYSSVDWNTNGESNYAYGGAVYLNASTVNLHSCEFDGNYSRARESDCCTNGGQAKPHAWGGAIAFLDQSLGSITGCTFTNSRAESDLQGASQGGRRNTSLGGHLYLSQSSPAFEGCLFQGGTAGTLGATSGADTVGGGAVFCENLAGPNFLNCQFVVNQTESLGGAFRLEGNAAPFMFGCNFASNMASAGGALYSNNSSPVLAECTVESNSSTDAAVQSVGSGGFIPLIGSTFFCANDPTDVAGPYINEGGNTFAGPDCAGDCDGDGVTDAYQILGDPSLDCDENGQIDSCEILNDPQLDCDQTGGLDACEGAGADCDGNGILDDCEPDCNENGFPDPCEILEFGIPDCDGNSVPDECDLDNGAADCDSNGVPDACDPDCDGNGIPDGCESIDDCNSNGIPDNCDANDGLLTDRNADGVFDQCQTLDYLGLSTEIVAIADRTGTPEVPSLAVCYRVYADFNVSGGSLISMYGEEGRPFSVQSPSGFFQHPSGGNLTSSVECVPNQPSAAYDSWLTIGLACESGPFTEAGINFTPFNNSTGFSTDDGFILQFPGTPQTVVPAGQRVLLMQLTPIDGLLPSVDVNMIGTNSDGSDWVALGQNIPEPPLVDCNSNGIQDAYDIAGGVSLDCDADGIPDECIWPDPYADCNGNGVEDLCDIEASTSTDDNLNGIPDECECSGDVTGDGEVNVQDIIRVILDWGEPGGPSDLDGSGEVGLGDLLLAIQGYGLCL